MRRYRLSEHDVAAVVAEPEWREEEDDGHIQIAWVRREDEYLKVVYAVEEDNVIITLGLRARLPEGLRHEDSI